MKKRLLSGVLSVVTATATALTSVPALTQTVYAKPVKESNSTGQSKNAVSDNSNKEYRDGEVIVMYKPSASKSVANVGEGDKVNIPGLGKAEVKGDLSFDLDGTEDVLDNVGVSESSSADELDIKLIKSDKYSTKQLINALEDNPNVAAVTPNYTVKAASIPTLSGSKDLLWGLDNQGQNGGTADSKVSYNTDINLDALDSKKRTTDKPVIAIIDTGIDYNNTELCGRTRIRINLPASTDITSLMMGSGTPQMIQLMIMGTEHIVPE